MTFQDYSDVAIVMITKNEEGAIRKVVTDSKKELKNATVFVIDGSTDRTKLFAMEAGAIVFDEPGGGFGPALQKALHSPDENFSIILTIDADDTYPVEMFRTLVQDIRDGYDVSGANRLTLFPTKNMPLPNFLMNKLFNLLASIRTGQKLSDVHSGQRAYRRQILHSFNWNSQGLAFPVDLLLWPALFNYKIIERDIIYKDRIGNSKLQRLPSGIATIKRLFYPRKKINRNNSV
jgi:glycosyltransferase involved in cell wall biosynthesis